MSNHSSRGTEWNRLREAVMNRDNHLCQYCIQQGRHTQATHVDHILAKSLGGKDEMENLIASCRDCNLRKGTKQIIRQNYMNPRFFK